MDDLYITEKLKAWVPLFYGKNKAISAVAFVRGSKYIFGYENAENTVLNSLDKPIALYLAAHQLPNFEPTITHFIKKKKHKKYERKT